VRHAPAASIRRRRPLLIDERVSYMG
jgi:hypothetical protein